MKIAVPLFSNLTQKKILFLGIHKWKWNIPLARWDLFLWEGKFCWKPIFKINDTKCSALWYMTISFILCFEEVLKLLVIETEHEIFTTFSFYYHAQAGKSIHLKKYFLTWTRSWSAKFKISVRCVIFQLIWIEVCCLWN